MSNLMLPGAISAGRFFPHLHRLAMNATMALPMVRDSVRRSDR
jgi:hypothetical protein